jgi:membrane protease subunit HflK
MRLSDFEKQFSQGGGASWARPAAVGILLLAVFYVLMNSFYTVKANEQAVVLRFGKYHTTSLPGLHFCIPLVDSVLHVSIEEHSVRLPTVQSNNLYGGDGGDRYGDRDESDTLMLTGDLNAVSVEWTVQWKVQEPKDFLFSFYDRNNPNYAEEVIRMVSRTVMNRLIGDYSIDEVLTDKRTEIAEKARVATQQRLDAYDCGVAITDLQMQRATPPSQVKPAFAAVNSAVQLRDQLENEANKERNKLIPGAKADRDKSIREAEGYAARRRAEVNGEISALMAKYEAYSQAPEVTRQRLYLETMQTVLSGMENMTILDADLQNGVLPLMHLDQGVVK